ncbi:acyltransferase [Novipirellula caenicola]|uniref:Acyltransferase 3 domain-containing protein n=1 Tax=Novipirellula caenicola TaxID=1536901 RepID=A0ABP9W117_9BACT
MSEKNKQEFDTSDWKSRVTARGWISGLRDLQLTPGWFRLLLATAVVLYHTSKVVFFGYWAVFVFFVLSGFWLTEMFRKKYMHAKNTTLVFQASRVFRIMPVFLASSLLGLATAWGGFGGPIVEHAQEPLWVARSLVPLGNSALQPRLIETVWSLDIEVQFYLLFPIIYAAMISRKQWAMVASCAALAAITWIAGYENSLLTYALMFMIGILISHLDWQASSVVYCASITLILALFVGVLIYPESRSSLLSEGAIIMGGHDLTRAFNVAMALITVPFVSLNVRVKETSMGYHAGNLSYPIYLIHWVLLGPYIAWYGGLPGRERLPYFIGYLALSFIVSLAIYALIDRPIDRLRRNFVSRYTAKPSASKSEALAA